MSQSFTAVYSHPADGKGVVSAFLLIEDKITGYNACFLEYSSRGNTVNLMTDDGRWQTPLKAGSPGSLENRQCSVDAAQSRGSIDGKTLTAKFAISFQPSYKGSKRVFMTASSLKQASSWEPKGAWTIE
jgi:hypothetical protein